MYVSLRNREKHDKIKRFINYRSERGHYDDNRKDQGNRTAIYEKNEKRPGQRSSSGVCFFCNHGFCTLFHATADVGSVYGTFTGDGDVYPDGDAASQFL